MSPLRRHTPLKRTPIRRRPRRNRTLTPEKWAIVIEMVELYDRDAVIEFAEKSGWTPIFLKPNKPPTVTFRRMAVEMCPAVVMDPSELGNCYGSWKRDHVKDDPRLGVKADDDIWHLVSLCAAHDERGMRAGHVWNTAHREEERTYLREHRPERPRDGGSGE